MTPALLLVAARNLVEAPGPEMDGIWPRAAALLLRQALEGAVRGLLEGHVRHVDALNLTVQFVCLADVIGPERARKAAFVWSAVSTACHHHGYELPPTVAELRSWAEAVEEIVEAP